MSVDSEARPQPSEPDAADTAGEQAQLGATLAAGAGLFAALRRVGTAVGALLTAEARVLGASIGMVFLAGVALVAFAVSLWACVVALIGWGLAVATGSIGIALGILVALHLVLVAGIWIWIKRAIRRASFPATRAELGALGRELRRDVARFQYAQPQTDASSATEAKP